MWDLSFWFWTQLLCKLKWVFGDIFFFFFYEIFLGYQNLQTGNVSTLNLDTIRF